MQGRYKEDFFDKEEEDTCPSCMEGQWEESRLLREYDLWGQLSWILTYGVLSTQTLRFRVSEVPITLRINNCSMVAEIMLQVIQLWVYLLMNRKGWVGKGRKKKGEWLYYSEWILLFWVSSSKVFWEKQTQKPYHLLTI